MTKDVRQPERLASMGADAAGDIVLPFRTETAGVLGHLVRLGPAADRILNRHDYPEPVSRALAEALALTAMLGVALKLEGRLTLQTSSEGILGFLVVHFDHPGTLRGYASFDKERWAAAEADGAAQAIEQGELLGNGHLAITIDPGGSRDRYQGIVALESRPLAEAVLAYFRQSEQLPSFLRLAVARHYAAGTGGAPGSWTWRAGGLLLQYVSQERQIVRPEAESEADEQALPGDANEEWQRVKLLAGTVEDHELTDPMLGSERLLYRLFHEEGVRVFELRRIAELCRCSRERVAVFLRQFGADDLAAMREEDGSIGVTCEFCSTRYQFGAGEIEGGQ